MERPHFDVSAEIAKRRRIERLQEERTQSVLEEIIQTDDTQQFGSTLYRWGMLEAARKRSGLSTEGRKDFRILTGALEAAFGQEGLATLSSALELAKERAAEEARLNR